MKEKVLILTNRDTGLFFFRREVLQALHDDGYEIYISVPKGDYTDDLRDMGCRIIYTDVDRRGKNPMKDLKLLRSYKKIIKKVNPSIVLTYTIKPNIYGGFACGVTNTKQLANITGLGTEIERGGITAKILLTLYKLSLRKAQCVFVQNTTIDQILEKNGIACGRRTVIPGSGVNLGAHNYIEYPTDDSVIHFLFIGRVMKDKGFDELLYAAKKIKAEHPNIVFDIVGRCDEEKYEEIIQDFCERGIIAFHGFQKDVNPFLGKAHALIQPSYHEGLSNVLLEAASTGRPVLASKVPGCQETFDDGVTGIGFEAKSGEALYETIKKFLMLPNEKRKEMGILGRQKVEKEFNRQLVVDSYMNEINRK